MGSTKPQPIVSSALSLVETYSTNFTESFDVESNDSITFEFDADAGSLTTGFAFKLQSMPAESDLYKPGDAAFALDEMIVPITADTAGQKRTIRLDTRGLGKVRMGIRSVDGTATMNTVNATRDGSSTNTPPS